MSWQDLDGVGGGLATGPTSGERMRTQASIEGRPLRIALGWVPALLLGIAFLCDLIGVLSNRESLWSMGGRLAEVGLTAGVLATIARHFVEPDRRTSRGRSWTRAVPRLTALGVYALARWARGAAEVPPEPVLLTLQALSGVGLLFMAWWRGGVRPPADENFHTVRGLPRRGLDPVGPESP